MPGMRGPTPLLRLQSDERLVALVRRGQHAAFDTLVSRYEARLLAFCRHMLGSREDAEDVLQEVFAAAFNAMLADERPIHVRPWLYRIARNRSLNHLRRATPIGVDSMDIHFADHGQSTGDKVFKREQFRELIGDVQRLPETQRTALLLREIDAMSYDQIAEAMETTVPSVKSLLVRARISLAEASEARQLSCDEVRLELGEVAEGLAKTSAPVRRHLRDCDRCRAFRGHLKANNQAMAAIFPVSAFLLVKKVALTKLGSTASAGGAHVGSATAAGAGAGATAAGAGAAGAGVAGAGGGAGLITAGAGAVAAKAVAGIAAAVIVTAGAVDVSGTSSHHHHHAATVATAAIVPTTVPSATPDLAPATPIVHSPVVVRNVAQRVSGATSTGHPSAKKPTATTTTVVTTSSTSSSALDATKPPAPTTQVQSDVTVLPSTPSSDPTAATTTPVETTPPTTSSTSTPVATTPVATPPATDPTQTTTPVVAPPSTTATTSAPAAPLSGASDPASPTTQTTATATDTTVTTSATTSATSAATVATGTTGP